MAEIGVSLNVAEAAKTAKADTEKGKVQILGGEFDPTSKTGMAVVTDENGKSLLVRVFKSELAQRIYLGLLGRK